MLLSAVYFFAYRFVCTHLLGLSVCLSAFPCVGLWVCVLLCASLSVLVCPLKEVLKLTLKDRDSWDVVGRAWCPITCCCCGWWCWWWWWQCWYCHLAPSPAFLQSASARSASPPHLRIPCGEPLTLGNIPPPFLSETLHPSRPSLVENYLDKMSVGCKSSQSAVPVFNYPVACREAALRSPFWLRTSLGWHKSVSLMTSSLPSHLYFLSSHALSQPDCLTLYLLLPRRVVYAVHFLSQFLPQSVSHSLWFYLAVYFVHCAMPAHGPLYRKGHISRIPCSVPFHDTFHCCLSPCVVLCFILNHITCLLQCLIHSVSHSLSYAISHPLFYFISCSLFHSVPRD